MKRFLCHVYDAFCTLVSLTIIVALVAWFLWFMTTIADASERDALVRLPGGSGVVLDDAGLILTAKHMGFEFGTDVPAVIAGRSVSAHVIYEPSEFEGVIVLDAAGDGYESIPIAETAPNPGDLVHSMGFPGGAFAHLEGRYAGPATLSDGKSGSIPIYKVDYRILPGNSGGPLINADGELIGIASVGSTDKMREQSSGWLPLPMIQAAYTGGVASAKALAAKASTPIIYVFSAPNCDPCQRLHRDIDAGKFRGYEFRIVYPGTPQWTAALAKMRATVDSFDESSFAAPAVWPEGSRKYTVGYTSDRNLLTWLGDAIRFIVGIPGRVLGLDEPQPQGPIVTPIPAEPLPAESEKFERKRSELDSVIRDLLALKSDVDKLRDEGTGLLGKISALKGLKEEVGQVKADIGKLREPSTNEDGESIPWYHGLWAGLLGAFKRRYLNGVKAGA